MKIIFLVLITALLTLPVDLFAQNERKDKTAVTYEQIYDEPYAVNKLFIALQPLYGELFVTNVNAGFGIEASYYYQDKADFKAQFRKTYSRKFYDLSRDLAMNNPEVDNRIEVYNYFEVGGTYHIKDFEESSKTKMFLYKKSYKGNTWASRVPLSTEVPCKVRKIYGVRAGGIFWDSSTDINRALAKQDLTNADLKDPSGVGLPLASHKAPDQTMSVFSNIAATTVYLGGSASWIRNVAVSIDKFEEGIDDLMFTAYFDVLYAPSISLDDIVYTDLNPASPNAGTRTYSVSPLKLQSFGFRAGIDGRFNRALSWAYGGEVGYRPSIEGRTFYALLKISFPVFGSNLDDKVESFEK
jgi:hypothetical protein